MNEEGVEEKVEVEVGMGMEMETDMEMEEGEHREERKEEQPDLKASKGQEQEQGEGEEQGEGVKFGSNTPDKGSSLESGLDRSPKDSLSASSLPLSEEGEKEEKEEQSEIAQERDEKIDNIKEDEKRDQKEQKVQNVPALTTHDLASGNEADDEAEDEEKEGKETETSADVHGNFNTADAATAVLYYSNESNEFVEQKEEKERTERKESMPIEKQNEYQNYSHAELVKLVNSLQMENAELAQERKGLMELATETRRDEARYRASAAAMNMIVDSLLYQLRLFAEEHFEFDIARLTDEYEYHDEGAVNSENKALLSSGGRKDQTKSRHDQPADHDANVNDNDNDNDDVHLSESRNSTRNQHNDAHEFDGKFDLTNDSVKQHEGHQKYLEETLEEDFESQHTMGKIQPQQSNELVNDRALEGKENKTLNRPPPHHHHHHPPPVKKYYCLDGQFAQGVLLLKPHKLEFIPAFDLNSSPVSLSPSPTSDSAHERAHVPTNSTNEASSATNPYGTNSSMTSTAANVGNPFHSVDYHCKTEFGDYDNEPNETMASDGFSRNLQSSPTGESSPGRGGGGGGGEEEEDEEEGREGLEPTTDRQPLATTVESVSIPYEYIADVRRFQIGSLMDNAVEIAWKPDSSQKETWRASKTFNEMQQTQQGSSVDQFMMKSESGYQSQTDFGYDSHHYNRHQYYPYHERLEEEEGGGGREGGNGEGEEEQGQEEEVKGKEQKRQQQQHTLVRTIFAGFEDREDFLANLSSSIQYYITEGTSFEPFRPVRSSQTTDQEQQQQKHYPSTSVSKVFSQVSESVDPIMGYASSTAWKVGNALQVGAKLSAKAIAATLNKFDTQDKTTQPTQPAADSNPSSFSSFPTSLSSATTVMNFPRNSNDNDEPRSEQGNGDNDDGQQGIYFNEDGQAPAVVEHYSMEKLPREI